MCTYCVLFSVPLSSYCAQALKKVRREAHTPQAKASWMEEACLDAVLGSCSFSLPSVRSGVRCYIAFVGVCLLCFLASARQLFCGLSPWACLLLSDRTCSGVKCYFPPQLQWLLAWSTLFRSEGTLSNYIGYVRTACLVVGAPVQVCCLTAFFVTCIKHRALA